MPDRTRGYLEGKERLAIQCADRPVGTARSVDNDRVVMQRRIGKTPPVFVESGPGLSVPKHADRERDALDCSAAPAAATKGGVLLLELNGRRDGVLLRSLDLSAQLRVAQRPEQVDALWSRERDIVAPDALGATPVIGEQRAPPLERSSLNGGAGSDAETRPGEEPAPGRLTAAEVVFDLSEVVGGRGAGRDGCDHRSLRSEAALMARRRIRLLDSTERNEPGRLCSPESKSWSLTCVITETSRCQPAHSGRRTPRRSREAP